MDLFGEDIRQDAQGQEPQQSEQGQVRLILPDRFQLRLETLDIDGLIEENHPARNLWRFVQGLDLSCVVSKIASRGSRAGRPAGDPKVFMALWLYATTQGVGSARLLERLCLEHNAYRWICGGVPVNYHTLSDFRMSHVDELDLLLTQSIAALVSRGIVTLERVSQDGVRVRASAGKSTFRRREKLEEHLEQAREQVEALRQELEADPGACTKRVQAARQRAAREREQRVGQALEELKKIETARNRRAASPERRADTDVPQRKPKAADEDPRRQARASTTDPCARRMKMANGGFDPAYNIQYATDNKTRMVVGVLVTNQATDTGLLKPMSDNLTKRYARLPAQLLADGSYVHLKQIDELEGAGCALFIPPKQTGQQNSRFVRYKQTPNTKAWRERMQSEQGKQIYRERSSVSEFVHAQMRNHGLRLLNVRSRDKIRAVALWNALAFNLERMKNLAV